MHPMGIADNFVLPRVFQFQSTVTLHTSFPIKNPLQKDSRFSQIRKKKLHFSHRTYAALGKSDFVTRVLEENPSLVEPRYKVGDKFYTLKEKEDMVKESHRSDGAMEILKRLNLKGMKNKKGGDGIEYSENVHLKDLLREFKGKLYVPEQIFTEEFSEEEQFDKDLDLLPRMSFEDFQKAIKGDKIKLLTFKEDDGVSSVDAYKDFIVDLEDIPGLKNHQRTKWSVKVEEDQVQTVLEKYIGPRYGIEIQKMSCVEKLPEYANPEALSISSKVIVELGVVTAAIAAAAAVIGGFIASAAFAVTSFVYAGSVYVIWPMLKPCIFASFDTLKGIGDIIVDMFADGWISTKLYEFYRYGFIYSSLRVGIPMLVVFAVVALFIRFTLSRRPKDFRKWDIWQGIEFSQSKAQARVDGSTGVTFSDVAGIDTAVNELQELVNYLKNPELFDKMGIKPPHGVLLEGPPGCGKTLVAKAIAGEAGVPFYQMAGSEFVEVLVGVGSARIRDLFKRATVNKPSVIFIDEIDALATRRQGISSKPKSDFYNADTQERETTLNQLLIELDGFDTGKGVIFLGATNRMDLLDPAILRPGRFDRKIRIRPPTAKGRLEILKVHARKVKLSETVDLSIYAQNLPGWTGAKLAQLLQEAALVAVRNKHNSILRSDVDEAVDRLTVGPKLVGMQLGHQGQCRRAATQVGMAMTSHLLRRSENAKVEPCDRISIHPRGATLSQIVFNRLEDNAYVFERRPQLLHRLQVLLGARAAEEVIFGRDTSKESVKYLADATWLARKIITIWNFESPMTIHGEPPPWRRKAEFLGPRIDFEGSLYRGYGLVQPPLNSDMEDEVAKRTEELISDMYGKTVALLKRHHTALLKTVKVLLHQLEISGQEMDVIMDKYPPNTPTSLLLEERDPRSLTLLG